LTKVIKFIKADVILFLKTLINKSNTYIEYFYLDTLILVPNFYLVCPDRGKR